MLPAYNFTHTMMLLMRIQTESSRWLKRLIVRDRRDGMGHASGNSHAHPNSSHVLAPPTHATHAHSLTSPTAVARYAFNAASQAHSSSQTSTNSRDNHTNPFNIHTVTVTIPAMLHWIYLLHQSILCKSTFIFWNIIYSKNAEIKGYTEEMSQKLDKLDVNYIGLIDRLVKRLPNCYSFEIVLDCSELDQIVDMNKPLQLIDMGYTNGNTTQSSSSSYGHQSTDADSPISPSHSSPPTGSGGLAKYPILFTWPQSRSTLEKWNLISTLLSHGDLFAGYESLPPNSSTSSSFRQTNTSIATLGPSHHQGDWMIWDYENEGMQLSKGITPVSYFIARLDLHKSAYIVITFQSTDIPSSSLARDSTNDSTISSVPVPPLNSSSSSSSLLSSNSSSNNPLSPPQSSSLPLAPPVRKKLFDQILTEFVPILQKLRHMHVFQQMQPMLGVKKKG